jgi:hypothetical protein
LCPGPVQECLYCGGDVASPADMVVCPTCSNGVCLGCMRKILTGGFPGPHISFTFMDCGYCKVRPGGPGTGWQWTGIFPLHDHSRLTTSLGDLVNFLYSLACPTVDWVKVGFQ